MPWFQGPARPEFFFFFIFSLFFCFFLLFILLLLLSASSSPWSRLPFLAGEVGCLFWQIFCMVVLLRAWVRVAVAEFFVICHCPNQGWESTHKLHLYPLGGVFYSPWYRARGRGDLDFTSLSNDSREPWVRLLVSRLDSLAGVVTRNRAVNSGHPSKYWPWWVTI